MVPSLSETHEPANKVSVSKAVVPVANSVTSVHSTRIK